MAILQWLIAYIGHAGLWCELFNRLHATALPRWGRKGSEYVCLFMLVVPGGYLALQLLTGTTPGDLSFVGQSPLLLGYTYLSCFLAIPVFLRWLLRKIFWKRPAAIVEHESVPSKPDVERGKQMLHGRKAQALGLFPLNEATMLRTERMMLSLDVPLPIDGLRIAQLSDLHLTGYVDLAFFHHVVDRANAFNPDLVLISGDLIDRRECLDWIDEVFGKLQSRLGVYYVLGNHDVRVRDEALLRSQLESSGLKPLGGRWVTIPLGNAEICLAGNELPWFSGAQSLTLEPSDSQTETSADRMNILVSHSPDQLDWARPYNFDLMFAGHNHGGQVALPVIGPIIAPSKYGTKYASGDFQIGKMLMHVSRGLSADTPIRWNSPPELGLFTVRSNRTY